MKKKLHIYIIILTIGFFLLPNLNYACGTKVEKECCKKEMSSKKVEKDCCKNSQSNKNKSCGGKCGHTNCTTTSVNFSIVSLNEIEFKNNNFDFSHEKQKFYHSETFISSGFSFIWQPPKIK